MGTEKNTFSIRANGATFELACRSLKNATKGNGVFAACFREIYHAGMLELNADQGVYLQEHLQDYATTELREGCEDYKIALEFAAALGDHVVTECAKAAQAKLPVEDAGYEVPAEAIKSLASEEDVKAKRDDILNEIFTGGSHKRINVWGDVIEDPALNQTGHKALRQAAKVENYEKSYRGSSLHYKPTAPRFWLKGSSPLPSPIQPLADVEADRVLTGNTKLTFNRDMQVGDANAVLTVGTGTPGGVTFTAHDGVLQVGGSQPRVRTLEGVVGTVSGFMARKRG